MQQIINKTQHLSLTKVLSLVVFTCLFMVFFFGSAQASYGPWFPKPGSGSSGINYQADYKPFNDRNISEITSFACIMPNGNPIGDEYDDEKLLADINRFAAKIYAGDLESSDFSKNTYDGDLPDNVGFATGKAGMQDWLRMMKQALKEERVFYPLVEHMEIVNKDEQEQSYFRSSNQEFGFIWDYEDFNFSFNKSIIDNIQGIQADEYENVNPARFKRSRFRLSFLLNEKATTPLALNDKLPEGCLITPINPLGGVSITDLFDGDIGEQALNIILYIPGKLVEELYGLVAPLAFKYTFWTPHSERGDLVWTTPDACDFATVGPSPALSTGRKYSSYCSNGEALGFNKNKTDVKNQNSLYLNIARFVQWLVSGFYFLILFTAAVLFIFRGNRNGSINVLHMLPRLVLAVVLTLFSGFIIGAVISFSNLLVQMFFQSNDVGTVGSVNTILQQAGPIVGGGTFLERVVNILASAIALFCFILFVFTVIVRQIGLIVLVIVAPLAFLCLISPKWEANFWKWIRALLAIAMIPVLSAMILKISMSVNPLILDPAGSYGNVQGLLGIIILLATLYAMTKIMKSGRDFIMGQSGTASGMMQGAQNSRNSRRNRSALDGGGSGGGYGSSGGGNGSGDGMLIPSGRQSSGGGVDSGGYGRAMLNAGKEKVVGIGSKTISRDLNGSPSGRIEQWVNNQKNGSENRSRIAPAGMTNFEEISKSEYDSSRQTNSSEFRKARDQGGMSVKAAAEHARSVAGGEVHYSERYGIYLRRLDQPMPMPDDRYPTGPQPSKPRGPADADRKRQIIEEIRAKANRGNRKKK